MIINYHFDNNLKLICLFKCLWNSFICFNVYNYLYNFYFFFFSAHFAHNFVFITFVNSALLFFSTSRFFLFTLFLIDPFPLILFFFFLFSNAFLSSSSAFYCSYFSKIYLFVLSIVPITFGSTVMVYGGNFYSKLWTKLYLFCFFV